MADVTYLFGSVIDNADSVLCAKGLLEDPSSIADTYPSPYTLFLADTVGAVTVPVVVQSEGYIAAVRVGVEIVGLTVSTTELLPPSA